jgi:hypothetical protein
MSIETITMSLEKYDTLKNELMYYKTYTNELKNNDNVILIDERKGTFFIYGNNKIYHKLLNKLPLFVRGEEYINKIIRDDIESVKSDIEKLDKEIEYFEKRENIKREAIDNFNKKNKCLIFRILNVFLPFKIKII